MYCNLLEFNSTADWLIGQSYSYTFGSYTPVLKASAGGTYVLVNDSVTGAASQVESIYYGATFDSTAYNWYDVSCKHQKKKITALAKKNKGQSVFSLRPRSRACHS